MTVLDEKMFDISMRYEERFGHTYPRMIQAISDDDLIALYERCLHENRPYTDFIEIEELDDVDY